MMGIWAIHINAQCSTIPFYTTDFPSRYRTLYRFLQTYVPVHIAILQQHIIWLIIATEHDHNCCNIFATVSQILGSSFKAATFTTNMSFASQPKDGANPSQSKLSVPCQTDSQIVPPNWEFENQKHRINKNPSCHLHKLFQSSSVPELWHAYVPSSSHQEKPCSEVLYLMHGLGWKKPLLYCLPVSVVVHQSHRQ